MKLSEKLYYLFSSNSKRINDKIIIRLDTKTIKIIGKDIEYVANILDYKDLKVEDIPNGFQIIKDRDLILDWFYNVLYYKD